MLYFDNRNFSKFTLLFVIALPPKGSGRKALTRPQGYVTEHADGSASFFHFRQFAVQGGQAHSHDFGGLFLVVAGKGQDTL